MAEYRRQSQATADDLADDMYGQNKQLKNAVEIHIQTTRQSTRQISVQLADAETVAKQVKALMESAVSVLAFASAITGFVDLYSWAQSR